MRIYSTFLITVAMYQYNGSKSDNTNVIFLPSVVYYPINSMPWAYREAKEHFPFDTPVYFGKKETFINKSVQMLSIEELVPYVRSLDKGPKARSLPLQHRKLNPYTATDRLNCHLHHLPDTVNSSDGKD